MQERNKPKDDALISNVGIGMGGGATVGERRAGKTTGRGRVLQCPGCGVYAVPEGYPGRNDQHTVGYVDLPLRGGAAAGRETRENECLSDGWRMRRRKSGSLAPGAEGTE